ncbi:carbohydrate ABC transporter permease [Bauldia litoralis]|uniref:Carbohydrate ABC transporter membrane protein 1, CUT1 family (TC 3.A.1.1.-) n=1 Tax=Bauldia litoralis TaxID=665467 RepID=A0A1G6AFG4_9HYPH|nr:sugar ABC transporter permease [Bauldia litoralis]SDB07168.1 carbohydrate ABC transporter membrane protein 1, CUT1 family (TC 3.A.1.1.-) [Bauldia litoralis]
MNQSKTMEAADRRFGWFMSAPSLALLLAVILFPVFWALFTSVHDYTLIAPNFDTFTGAENYISAIQDPAFRHSLGLTAFFVAAVVLFEFLLGFIVALMLNSVERFKPIYYGILLCPLLMNPVIVGLIWRMFLHPSLGIVNYLLTVVGFEPVNWLGSTQMAIWTIIMVDIWHQVSFMIVLLLAGLSAMPKEPYEAARVDGARVYQSFFYITLPLMMPVIIVTLLIRMIFAVKTYDLIYIMTRGGPGVATDLVSYSIYRTAFVSLNVGEASAMSAILLGFILLLTVYLYRYMRSLT